MMRRSVMAACALMALAAVSALDVTAAPPGADQPR